MLHGIAHRVTMRHIPFDFDQSAHFASSAYCQAFSDGSWDVVIIDGQDKTFRERITCFRQAEPLMQHGSIILVDDFWRYEELLVPIVPTMYKSLSPWVLVELV